VSDEKSLAHSVWDCKYHIVWIPKCRKKQLYGKVAKYLGEIFHKLARQRESKIVQGHLCPDHIHMLIEIPPKYAVSQIVGYIIREKRNSNSPEFYGEVQELRGRKFLGTGILCINGRSG